MKRNHHLPLYLQVVRYFKQKISKGEIEAGEKLPSRRDVSQMFNINLNTSQRAYTILENEGLIITKNNSLSHITTDLLILQMVRKNLIREAADQYIETMKKIGITEEEILLTIRKEFK